jgi:hypothetical protein
MLLFDLTIAGHCNSSSTKQEVPMSTGTIVAIIVVVLVVAAVIAAVAYSARRRRLQQRFGPEYDRAVEDSGSRRKAEAELSEREKRVRHLDIQPLDPAARDSYASQWTAIQEQFVDSPTDAVTGAQSLITSVMNDRGYPTEDAAQIMADLSVEHASTLEHFRDAQDLSGRAAGGTASTEDLRQAMVHYRSLFQELLGDPTDVVRAGADPVGTDPVGTDPTTSAAAADPVVADPVVADSRPDTGSDTGTYASDAGSAAYTTPDDTFADGTARDDTMFSEPVRADTARADTVRTETVRTDTAPADAVPADTDPATNGATAAHATTDESAAAAEADEEDERAGAGRLFRRR